MKNFKGKVAVITGAASGLGRALAGTGAQLGMRLVLADIEPVALQRASAELQAQGAQVLAHCCDVSRGEAVQALADAAMAEYGVVHLLFNNAGVGVGGLIWENSQSDWEWVLGVNLWGVIHGIRLFTPLMLASAQADPAYAGHIVNTASVAGLLNAPAMGVYNVSKHAVVALSETLYHDLQLIGAPVGVSVLCPYFVPTAISQSARNRPPHLQNSGETTASQRAAQQMAEQAASSGRVSPAQVASLTFEAIRHNQFYIYSHPALLDNVRARMEEIIQQKNPADPLAATPQLRAQLLAARSTPVWFNSID